MKSVYKYIGAYIIIGSIFATTLCAEVPPETENKTTQTEEREEVAIFGVIRDHGVLTVTQLSSAEALQALKVELRSQNTTDTAQAINASKLILDGVYKSARGLVVLGRLGGKFICKTGSSAWEWLKIKAFRG